MKLRKNIEHIRLEKKDCQKTNWQEMSNRFISTSGTVLDAVKVSDLKEVSDQNTDSNAIERGKVLYIAKVFSNLLLNGE